MTVFVEYLDERQQSALLHYAYEVMCADKRIDAGEQLLMDTLRAQTLPGVEAEDVALADLGDLFEDRLTRMALLLELIGVGYVDDSFSPSESGLIWQVAVALQVQREELQKVESWVGRQMALVREARDLMEG